VAASVIMMAALAPGAGIAALASDQGSVRFSLQHRVGFTSGDDWEPAIAADRFGHEYVLYKHYDVPGGGTCPACDVHLLVQRSSNGGRSWTAPRAIAPVAVDGGQYDPQIAVDAVDGRTVWASFLQNANSVIGVVESTDFGETWSPVRIVSGGLIGLDKDSLLVRGRTVAVAYDDGFNTYASISQDGGRQWTTRLVTPGSDRFNLPLSAGGGIDSKGNLFFAWNSFDAAHSANGDGPVTLWLTRSSDEGKTWQRVVIGVSGAPPPCSGCGFAYLSAQMTMRIGPDDAVYLLWNGTVDQTNFAPERIFFSRSLDHGRTFSPRREVSTAPAGAEHAFPAIAIGDRAGDVRFAWMDTRQVAADGTGTWNVRYRTTEDDGQTLGPEVRISRFVPGYPYLTPAGFASPYGDYFQMAIDANDATVLAFGEGPNYGGPGNIWVSHQLQTGEPDVAAGGPDVNSAATWQRAFHAAPERTHAGVGDR
jgi:BNR repeat protein